MENLKKYPRTKHLPFSETVSSDDKMHDSLDFLLGKKAVITVKRDGENSNIYQNYMHARSLDSRNHPSRNWLKQFASTFQHNIPDGWRICGENLYAKHSIEYVDLKSYFECFSVWDENNNCLSWSDTQEFCEMLGVDVVPTLYVGETDEQHLKSIIKSLDLSTTEGIVVRLYDSFAYDDFGKSVGKWVRKNHVATDEHWMNSEIIPNKLKKEKQND